MKMGDIYAARALVSERERLSNERDYVAGGHFTVSLTGRFLGQEFVEAAKPAVTVLYDELIASIDEQLRALGVDID